MIKTTVVTSATGEPVTLSDVKDRLRITSTDEDDDINLLITSARQYLEDSILGRKLMPQTWRLHLDAWPDDDHIVFPEPIRSVTSTGVVYKMSTGNSTSLSSTKWEADSVAEPGRLALRNNSEWPSDSLYNVNPITVDFACGYAGSTAVPEIVKTSIKKLCAEMYENREETVIGQTIEELPQSAKKLVQNWREWAF